MNEASAALIAACVAFAPAMAAVYIGWRQYVLEQRRLRFDLFEKRFACYEAVLNQIRLAIRECGWPEETDKDFLRQFEAARFLFPDPISRYMQALRQKLIEFSSHSEAVADTPIGDPERPHYLKLRRDGLKILRAEYPKVAELFVPYMAIDPPKE